jgi:hypothetical protein
VGHSFCAKTNDLSRLGQPLQKNNAWPKFPSGAKASGRYRVASSADAKNANAGHPLRKGFPIEISF